MGRGFTLSSVTPAQRTLVFTYSTTIKDLPADSGTLKLWLPLPVSDANQTVSDLSITSPYPYRVRSEPRFGNSLLFVEVDKPAKPSLNVEVRFKVTRKEYRKNLEGWTKEPSGSSGRGLPDADKYLKPDALVPISGKIRDLALKVTEGKKTPLEKVRAIYDFVTWTLKYDKSGTGWGRGDALYACDAKHGNCTDFHSLFIAMARSVGIPAKFEIGFPIPENQKSGEIAGYHCWAEFYIQGIGWIPVDSSEASKDKEKANYFFGTLDVNRVQFTQGRDLELVPPQAGKPLNYFVYPYAEVDGREFSKIDRKFSFEDVQ
ncbi:MAG: transglutaminase domain-containing protein [Acidobacteriia bacterium]|nr:transglutaminase domain-containing protein [Terriglobia bacterium]